MISLLGKILMCRMKKCLTEMRMIHVCVAVMAVTAIVSSCGSRGGRDAGSQADGGRLEYRSEINEVEVVTLKRQDFPQQLLSNGRLSASRRSALFFRQSGAVARIDVTNGGAVASGQVIAELENGDQREALESARIDLDRATLDLQDALVGLGYPVERQDSVPEEVMKVASIRSGYSAALNSVAKAQRALDGTVLRAPFSGRVADIKLKEWETVGSEAFCTVLSDSAFDVNFTVLESEFPFISKGQAVDVTAFGGGTRVSGRIASVNPTVDKNGQITVTARVPGGPGLLDGMNVKVTVSRTVARQLVVPKSAVVIRDGMEVLFRYGGGGKAEWVYVNTIGANSESYAVQANEDRGSELNEGDMVIVSGNLNLADGSRVELKDRDK